MRREILRMEHILCKEEGQPVLNDASFQVFEGEIYGILVLEPPGIEKLVDLMLHNGPLEQGRVYVQEQLVNRPGMGDGSRNPITVVGRVSQLFPDMTIADNLLTTGSVRQRYIIPRRRLREETRRHLKEADLSLDPDLTAGEIGEYESIIVEILRSVLSGVPLIVLWDVDVRLSSRQQDRLHETLRRWAGRGHTFLYIYSHHEVLRAACGRIAVFMGGRIRKVIEGRGELTRQVTQVYAQEAYQKLQEFRRKEQSRQAGEPVMDLKGAAKGWYAKSALKVWPGENILFHGRSADRIWELGTALMSLPETSRWGRISRERVLIPQDPIHRFLFPEMSAMENFCLPLAEKDPRFWRKPSFQRSVYTEYNEMLGGILDEPDLYRLSTRQRYDLVYLRYLASRPELVICAQPLMEADMNLRTHILELMTRLQEHAIAVLVLGTELYDTIYLADRLLQEEETGQIRVYEREEFGNMRKQGGAMFPD